MSTPAQPITALTDQENVQMDVVDTGKYDVATAYALLASAPRPAVIRGEDLEE